MGPFLCTRLDAHILLTFFCHRPAIPDGSLGADLALDVRNSAVSSMLKTAGRVTAGDSRSFLIGDGSGVPVKVHLPTGVTPPDDGTYVAVTGISSC